MISVRKLDEKRWPRLVRAAIPVLDKVPNGMLMDYAELCEALRTAKGRFANFSKHPALESYRWEETYHAIFWGNPETVRGLREKRANVKR